MYSVECKMYNVGKNSQSEFLVNKISFLRSKKHINYKL